MKKEFATMHLRRLLVVLLGNYPEFFFNLLKYSLATTYGQDRLDESEIARREKAGKIKAGQSADFRLPGPFSFVTYCKHITNALILQTSAVYSYENLLFIFYNN